MRAFLRVNLTGGEPLVRRDFLDIVDYLVDHHVVIHQIYSNGRLVTHKPGMRCMRIPLCLRGRLPRQCARHDSR